MKYTLVCGGTAGHISPALAIADALKASDPRATIAFIGTKNGMENRIVPEAGYPLSPIHMYGLSRSLSLKNIAAFFLLFKAYFRAKEILRSLSPDLLIATGGYITYPCARAAKALGIPVILHESNAIPGLAVRMSEQYSDRILLNFDAAKSHLRFPDRTVTVGMPVRHAFRIRHEDARKKLGLSPTDRFLLSFGGSLGAKAINDVMMKFYQKYAISYPSLFCLHGTGASNYKTCMEQMKNTPLPQRIRIVPYIDDMATVMAAADLVITRAGAATLSEITNVCVPAILIPSPNVVNNHQRMNAEAYAAAGAALVLPEEELDEDRLHALISGVLFGPTRGKHLLKELKKMHIPDTNERILKEIFEITRQKNKAE